MSVANPIPEAPGSFRVVTIVEAHDLGLVSIGGRRLGVVDVGMVFRASDDGTLYVLPAEAHSVNLTEDQYQAENAGFAISQIIDTEGRTGAFRIVVQEQGSGRAGSLWVDAIPPPE